MHPALAFAGTHGPGLAGWLLAHADDLGAAYDRLARPALAAVTDPAAAALDRIGPALVALHDGQTEVIGLLHHHTTTLDGVAAAVDGIGAGQAVLGQSLGLLTALSMVGLGAAALSQVHLAVQFRALTRRIKTIDARVRAVQEMLAQEHRARLAKGLDDLRTAGEVAAADPAAGREFTYAARNDLAGSRASYAEQLAGNLASAAPAGPAYPWMLARHLTTAALGEAACHLRLAQPDQAAGVLRAAAAAVARHAAAVFGRTVGADPARFLIPATAGHGLTLEAMAELYRQAGHAGAVRGRPAATAAALFEGLRGRLGAAADPRFGRAAKVERLRAEFAEAAAAAEEVNRLRGLALAVGAYHRPGRTYADLTAEILREVDARRPADGTYLAFFPDAAGPTAGREPTDR